MPLFVDVPMAPEISPPDKHSVHWSGDSGVKRCQPQTSECAPTGDWHTEMERLSRQVDRKQGCAG